MPNISTESAPSTSPAFMSEELVAPVSYHQIMIAEDPHAAFEQIANDPEKVQSLLHESAQDVAHAGVELQLGLHKKLEKRELAERLSDYETLLGFAAESTMSTAINQGASEQQAKREAVNLMVNNVDYLLGQDIQDRLKSPVQRFYEMLGDGTKGRYIGKMALTGAIGAGSMLGARELFPDVALQISVASAGAVSTQVFLKALTDPISSRVHSLFDRYRQSGQREDRYVLQDQELELVQGRLASVATNVLLEEGATIPQLAGHFAGVVGSSLVEFYPEIGAEQNQIRSTGLAPAPQVA